MKGNAKLQLEGGKNKEYLELYSGTQVQNHTPD